MPNVDRRHFLKLAAAMGATLAWGCASVHPSTSGWRERRELYPQGVASGDPDADSVLLWTRRPYADGRDSAMLIVEVAEDAAFTRVIATASAKVQAASDWTCRVLVGHLPPAGEYWYRFVDEAGNGSRIGRTLTAPADDDPRPAKFAFVSCQCLPEGYNNGYRRMIHEDENASREERLGFVLHLGDFIYEVVQYPDQVKNGRYDRKLTFPITFPKGKVVARNRFWVPDSLEDYRVCYKAYLLDPDLQDARARWPFVCVWDNHEISWNGWQSIQEFAGTDGWVPGQRLKVAGNQAWFEYQPARVLPPGSKLDTFNAPTVEDVLLKPGDFDDTGLGTEPNNLAAINSLIIYRALRWGRHIDLLLTDNRSFRSRDPGNHDEIGPLFEGDTLGFVPEELWAQLDAGRAYDGGHPPDKLSIGDRSVDNYVAKAAPQSMLGATQKAWFIDRLRNAKATWKVWGNSLGTLETRVDPQNLPPGIGNWKGKGYGLMTVYDWGSVFHERAEIYDAVRDAGMTGFAIVAGDRHSFWAGYAAKGLPPNAPFEPVGVSFVGGSMSSVGSAEANEYTQKKENNPTRALYIAEDKDGRPQATQNLTLRHGVRSAFAYAESKDVQKALAVRNPELAPHLTFVDNGGHGYATVRCDAEKMVTEFVCIPRPIARAPGNDGGPLRYRVRHEVPLWKAGEPPRMTQTVVEGDVGLSV
ncbi:alkaline phosphatase D family protein [Thermomonas aquatica]|uniref:Twin-arginine translocation signal domain-containing protein n=1 Tax=Thermomonas aquatica TaxID=2202149 RepID=A0A5B7ZLR4_9GAMM|nr:alkaline phosphatase D family protein [Thermomonas aquatica]QDA56214.1 twin-arginine translocation signal domain-containing protein [Thermomonas aquatica]